MVFGDKWLVKEGEGPTIFLRQASGGGGMSEVGGFKQIDCPQKHFARSSG